MLCCCWWQKNTAPVKYITLSCVISEPLESLNTVAKLITVLSQISQTLPASAIGPRFKPVILSLKNMENHNYSNSDMTWTKHNSTTVVYLVKLATYRKWVLSQIDLLSIPVVDLSVDVVLLSPVLSLDRGCPGDDVFAALCFLLGYVEIVKQLSLVETLLQQAVVLPSRYLWNCSVALGRWHVWFLD